jgi:hypothetical protein
VLGAKLTLHGRKRVARILAKAVAICADSAEDPLAVSLSSCPRASHGDRARPATSSPGHGAALQPAPRIAESSVPLSGTAFSRGRAAPSQTPGPHLGRILLKRRVSDKPALRAPNRKAVASALGGVRRARPGVLAGEESLRVDEADRVLEGVTRVETALAPRPDLDAG